MFQCFFKKDLTFLKKWVLNTEALKFWKWSAEIRKKHENYDKRPATYLEFGKYAAEFGKFEVLKINMLAQNFAN